MFKRTTKQQIRSVIGLLFMLSACLNAFVFGSMHVANQYDQEITRCSQLCILFQYCFWKSYFFDIQQIL